MASEDVSFDPAVHVEKRHVTMVNIVASGLDEHGDPTYDKHEAHDFVPVSTIDSYVADARERWQLVEVEDGHNPGPGGNAGDTHYADHLTRKAV